MKELLVFAERCLASSEKDHLVRAARAADLLTHEAKASGLRRELEELHYVKDCEEIASLREREKLREKEEDMLKRNELKKENLDDEKRQQV